MAISIVQLNKRLEKFASSLEGQEHGNIMVQLASTALTKVKDRIIKKGEDADGGKFDPYSTKPMLTNYTGMNVSAYNKVAGSKEKRKKLKWVTIGGHKLFELTDGYKEYRELHGRQTGHVDFVFSGKMMNDINLVSSRSELNSGVAVITTRKDEEQEKLKGNTERRGEILALSDKEVNDITGKYKDWVNQNLRKAGLV